MQKVLSLSALALGIALLGTVPVYADDGGDEGVEVATQENPNERVCRRVHVTGSNIPQRVCMSRAEWSELREESQEAVRENNRDMNANTSSVDAQ